MITQYLKNKQTKNTTFSEIFMSSFLFVCFFCTTWTEKLPSNVPDSASSCWHTRLSCIRDHLDRQRQMTGQRPLAIQNNVDDVTTSNYSPLPGQTCGEHPMQGWASGPLFQAPAIFKSVIEYKNPATFAAPQAPSSLAAKHRGCVLNAQDRCRWQHDKVLCRLAELLEMCRLEVKRTSLPSSQKWIQFVRQSCETQLSTRTMHSLLSLTGRRRWRRSRVPGFHCNIQTVTSENLLHYRP